VDLSADLEEGTMVERWLVETALSERYPFYTRANVGEVFPDPVSPFAFSGFMQNEAGPAGAELGFRDAYVSMGAFEPDEFPPDQCTFLGVAGGYCYLNASAMRLFGHRAPGMTAADIDQSFFGGTPDVPAFVPRPGDDRPDLTARLAETFGWVLSADSLPDVAEDERFVDELRAARPDLSTLSDRELVDRVWALADEHFRRLFGRHIRVSALAALPFGIINAVCNAVGQPTAVLRLVGGLGDVESAAPSLAMWWLGRTVAASDALTAAFDAGIDGLDRRLRAAAAAEPVDDAVAGFVAAFDDFLYGYGSRGPNEWEARSPTWETDPDLALAAIDRMRLAPEEASPEGLQRDRAAEREALGAQLGGALAADPATQAQFHAALRAATVFMPGRERTKTNCVKLVQELRVCLREWGRRRHDAGHFPRVNSYGMLTRDEVERVLDDPRGWREELERREALYDEVKGLQEPFLFVGRPPAMSTYPQRGEVEVVRAAVGERLQGLPGCTGTARGRARIVLDSHDPTALAPGDVLVAPITDPSWTPLFVGAAAVVVDVGAPLSHAIIVSRELGIPCAVSVGEATRRIPDGALVEVDGDTGTVTVLEG
jgi:rifampicin phosphotransferase